MVIIEDTEDIFKTDCTIIGHQISYKGEMNGGLITKKIKKLFPHVHEEYNNFIKTNNSEVMFGIGKVLYSDTKDGHIIANMVSLDDIDGRKITNYEAFEMCCVSIKKWINQENTGIYAVDKFSVAFPYGIGSNNDGEGDWDIIQDIIYKVFDQPEDTNIVCKIYKNYKG